MIAVQGTLAAASLAVLELDAASVGPMLLSRPFVIGPAFGAALGQPLLGAGLGVAVETVTLADLPLGGSLGLSAPVAAAVAVWLAAGPCALPAEAAFPAGLAAGWAHARIEKSLRHHRGVHVRRALERLSQEKDPLLGREIVSSLALQTLATFVLGGAMFLAAGPALSRLWPHLPQAMRAGARCAVLAAPWLGAGALAASLWRKS